MTPVLPQSSTFGEPQVDTATHASAASRLNQGVADDVDEIRPVIPRSPAPPPTPPAEPYAAIPSENLLSFRLTLLQAKFPSRICHHIIEMWQEIKSIRPWMMWAKPRLNLTLLPRLRPGPVRLKLHLDWVRLRLPSLRLLWKQMLTSVRPQKLFEKVPHPSPPKRCRWYTDFAIA